MFLKDNASMAINVGMSFNYIYIRWLVLEFGSRCNSVVRAFAHGGMGRRKGRRMDASRWTN